MAKRGKVKAGKSADDIDAYISSGIKIIQADDETCGVRFIECVIVENGISKPFYYHVPVTNPEKYKRLIKSKRFKEASFNPVKRGILLMDVVGYSRYDTLYQASILSLFNQAIRHALEKFKSKTGKNCLEQLVPTGDGCFVIFNPCVNDYFLKAAYVIFSEMNRMQDQLVGKYTGQPNSCEKMYLRLGCTIGETDFFIDPTGRRNCYGSGMNETERVLSLGQEAIKRKGRASQSQDSFFIHESLTSQAEELMGILRALEYSPKLSDLGTQTDKHGQQRRILWLHDLPPFEDHNQVLQGN